MKTLLLTLLISISLQAQKEISTTLVFQREDDSAKKLMDVHITKSSFLACLAGGGEDECVEYARASRVIPGNFHYYGKNIYNRAMVAYKAGEPTYIWFNVNGRNYSWYICQEEYERLKRQEFP